jgi:hypothetical protein
MLLQVLDNVRNHLCAGCPNFICCLLLSVGLARLLASLLGKQLVDQLRI